MASLEEHFIDRRLKKLDPFLEFQNVWQMFIILLFDECKPINFADSTIVTVVPILNILIRSFNIAINEIFLISLFNPFALLHKIQQEFVRKEPLIYCIVDSNRQITGTTLTLYECLYVCLDQVRDIVEGIDSDSSVERIERQTLIVPLFGSHSTAIIGCEIAQPSIAASLSFDLIIWLEAKCCSW